MRRTVTALFLGALVLSPARAAANDPDPFAFLTQEAEVVSASLQPQALNRAPATVYVVTGEDLRASGAQTFWDALRMLPAVDVMSTRSFHGEVSLRGLNKPLNNRTLILLDGKTVLNGFFDFVTWESIPVTLEEIDRIEVVAGPASALYGANAINGVVNIITKSHRQLDGLMVRYAPGENQTQFGTAILGGSRDRLSYRAGAGWRTGQRFEDGTLNASETLKMNGRLRYQFSEQSWVRVSAGLTDLRTQLSGGVLGTAVEDGLSGFLRTDYVTAGSRLRMFWNRGRTAARELGALQEPSLYYDTFDANFERTLAQSDRHSSIVGGSARHHQMSSELFEPRSQSQTLWSAFFEDRWTLHPRLDVAASGRLDRHPFAGTVFSPRGSVLLYPRPTHTLRVSGGTSFRNPTLVENYVQFRKQTANPGTEVPNPPFTTLELVALGNKDLAPEKLVMVDASYLTAGRTARTTATVFFYRLSDIITTTSSPQASNPPVFTNVQSFTNQGDASAWGAELGAEVPIGRSLALLANYSFQEIHASDDNPGLEVQSPRHKLNGGLRLRAGPSSGMLMAHWVDRTAWPSAIGAPFPQGYGVVDPHLLINLGFHHALVPLRGIEVGLSVFNLANHRHYQILQDQGPTAPGQFGEVIGRRVLATVTWGF